ncbi:MAG: RHS repeat-associated core domain-containing protein [Verrucomicrobiales bacterium]
MGQNSSVVNGDSTTINEYNADGALLLQSISGGPLDGVTLEQSFNDKGQREQFTASLPHNQSVAHYYGYDDKGRMQTVRQDDRQATYTYDDETGALTTTRFETAGEAIAETTREFDDLGRLTNISTRSLKEGGDFYQSFDYTYNDTNQRTRVAMEDGSYWEYQYDDLGQVISAKKYWRDGKPVAGQQFEYAFDGIGNRETAKYGGDTKGENLSEITYTKGTADSTQIGSIEHPGITYVTGKANEAAEVEVTVSATAHPEIDRQGEYFSAPVTIDNTEGASVESIDIAAREGDQSDTTTRRAYVPARQTQHLYDPDGNLLYDGRWHYEWDGENRLITMRTATESVRGSRSMELHFAYDHVGRRISKRVVEAIDGKLAVPSNQRFVYDDWNLVAELDTTGRAFRTHLWGLDLSGSTQGAGGVGGLLSTATTERAVYVSYDCNGNMTGEFDRRTGQLTSATSYDAFGNAATREFNSITPFGFSTKFADAETGHLYYGYRYYEPKNGHWLTRDPIGEEGGADLYGFVQNNAISKFDILGLDISVTTSGGTLLMILDDGKASKNCLTASVAYNLGIQWFEPLADQYYPVKAIAGDIGNRPELKHFTWDQIAEFALVTRLDISFRAGGSGDWKGVEEGGDGWLMVTVDQFPYWGDAIGQIPFAVDITKDNMRGVGKSEQDKIRVVKQTLATAREYSEGNIMGDNQNEGNDYDIYMVLRGAQWSYDKHDVVLENDWWRLDPYVRVPNATPSTDLGKSITKDQFDKYLK